VLFHDYGDYVRAVAVLHAALELDDKRADCLSLLASCKMELRLPPGEYMEYLRRATIAESTWVIPRQMLAQALIKVKKHREAAHEVELARLYVNSVREPSDPVDHYYECAVTGRLSSDVEELDRLEFLAG
jgi:hypothetical protein